MKHREEQWRDGKGASPGRISCVQLKHRAVELTVPAYFRAGTDPLEQAQADGADTAAGEISKDQSSERTVVGENPLPCQLEQEK